MKDDEPVLADELRTLRRAIPGLVVLVCVLVLLRGFEGTASALKLQISTFAQSFGGGGEELVRVLLHTMPLAVAAAIAAFAMAGGWLRFENLWSLVVLAGIVMAGAIVGGLLRGSAAREPETDIALLVDSPAVASTPPNDPPAKTILKSGPARPPVLQLPVADASRIRPPRKSALQQLREIEWSAEPNLENAPPGKISPLNLFPNTGGVPGIVLTATNQVLGYLVAYQPRLFLAAILAGGWLGWSWQRRLAWFSKCVARCVDEGLVASETRKAA